MGDQIGQMFVDCVGKPVLYVLFLAAGCGLASTFVHWVLYRVAFAFERLSGESARRSRKTAERFATFVDLLSDLFSKR